MSTPSDKKPSGKKPASKKKGPSYRIPPNGPWANAWKVAAAIGALGTVLSAVGMFTDPERFPFSWLFAFMTFLAVGLGGMFVTLIQHLMGSGWSVSVRRIGEFLITGLPLFALLFIPIAFNMDTLYPWIGHTTHEEGHEIHEDEEHGEEGGEDHEEHGALSFAGGTALAQDIPRPQDYRPGELEEIQRAAGEGEPSHAEHGEDEHADGEHDSPAHQAHATILVSKGWYLTEPFFLGRAALYFIVWILLAFFFFSTSTKQDKAGRNRKLGIQHSKRMEGLAPLSIIGFALSLTFAAFDWSMSLEPTWYSTIFGVQYFAVAVVISYALTILLTLGLQRAGHMGKAVSVEHFHDYGKLLFGFIIFWAYVSFSQFMLIWYAGIPEEATYYHLRFWGGGGFQNLTVLMAVAGFIIPFFMLLSRNAKRRLPVLAFGCAWLAVMHVVQTYWLIMPYAEQVEGSLFATSLHLHWLDFAALFSVGGIYFAFVLWMMTRYPLVPLGDPRLEQAMHHEVV